MSSSSKGPLDQFYKDCLRFGNIKVTAEPTSWQSVALNISAATDWNVPNTQGFAHFNLYLKGREELVVTIYHGHLSPRSPAPIARVSTMG